MVEGGRGGYLAVVLDEKLAELEGLQGKWQLGTGAAGSTGEEDKESVRQVRQPRPQ